jgi:hypothetical protein
MSRQIQKENKIKMHVKKNYLSNPTAYNKLIHPTLPLVLTLNVVYKIELEKMPLTEKKTSPHSTSKIERICSSQLFNFIRTKPKAIEFLVHTRLLLSFIPHEYKISFYKSSLMSLPIKCSFDSFLTFLSCDRMLFA